ncbi:response regulator [Paraburkholderia panacisoli]|uniref:Response regulator n=1 Tax=Paraburkholderia panacisoli TaxID=2603818 RepID=A0A5B0G924_9BURK|nr:response regulator [Paraburkholderia panacisoli]
MAVSLSTNRSTPDGVNPYVRARNSHTVPGGNAVLTPQVVGKVCCGLREKDRGEYDAGLARRGRYNLLRALDMLVRDDGYRVQTAAAAVAWMPGVPSHMSDRTLFVSDVMMPRLDGAKLARSLKGVPALANIPVAMMSALDLPPALPFYAFVPKPFAAARLLDVLREVLPPWLRRPVRPRLAPRRRPLRLLLPAQCRPRWDSLLIAEGTPPPDVAIPPLSHPRFRLDDYLPPGGTIRVH